MRHTATSILLTAFLLVSGCSFFTPHKIDVQQGNIITQEMLEQLEIGMDMYQVRYVIGSPMIVDTFNPLRWDYIYSIQPGRKARYQKHLSLYFDEAGELTKISELK